MMYDLRHVDKTISIFYKYRKIGCIGGDLKEKYGTIRWYVDLNPLRDLHDVLKPGHVMYRWDAIHHPYLDFINNLSKFFFRLKPILYLTMYYKILIYNIAYRHALLVNPGYEKEVLWSCDWEERIWGWNKLKDKYLDTDEEEDDV